MNVYASMNGGGLFDAYTDGPVFNKRLLQSVSLC